GQKAEVRSRLMHFFENIRFKNNKALIGFVEPGTDIAQLEDFLVLLLGAPPSEIDVQNIQIKNIELDSLKERARAHVYLSGQNLSTQKTLDINKIIFLFHEGILGNAQWFIDIKNLTR